MMIKGDIDDTKINYQKKIFKKIIIIIIKMKIIAMMINNN